MASDFLLVEAIALDFLDELEINSIGLLQALSLSRSLIITKTSTSWRRYWHNIIIHQEIIQDIFHQDNIHQDTDLQKAKTKHEQILGLQKLPLKKRK